MTAPDTRRLDGGGAASGANHAFTWPLRRAAWRVEENVIWAGSDAARSGVDAIRWPFESLAWAIRRRLLWPVQDAFRHRGWFGRIALGLVVAAVIGSAAVGGAAAVRELRSSGAGTATATSTEAPAPARAVATSPAANAAPAQTLQGVPPNFKSAPAEASSTVAPANPSVSAPANPSVAPVAKSKPSVIPAAPGGEAGALRTARAFAAAFVLYEVGQGGAKVKKAFSRTATPELAKSLRERPPRLPGTVDVPRAQVLNVILGERHKRQVEASASLLRLGSVSELRLTLTRGGHGWAVSGVRG